MKPLVPFSVQHYTSLPDLETRHAKCGNCGEIVRVGVPVFRPMEITLWWPVPLALIVWLALMWKFGAFLSSPQIEMPPPAAIEAQFVELPEAAKPPAKHPEVKQKSPPKPASKLKIKPRPEVPSHERIAAVQSALPSASAPEPDLSPPTDLMAYVNAAKARRNAAEMSAARENAQAVAAERGPTAEEIRTANIKRNLQPQGTNGVFQIISMSVRTAKFSFRGWTTNASNERRETIEVDAGPGGDVERAVVRSMIELIRKYYKGDFNWESPRLDRVVVLSARLEDNSRLEDFLIREFFGTAARSF